VRVWDLTTGTPLGDPLTGHTGEVSAVAAAEVDGRPVVISGSNDRTVRVWDLTRQRAMRRHLRRVQLRHTASVVAAILTQRRDRANLITSCTDGVSQTWDLSTWRVLSRTIVPGQSAVAAISALAPDHVLYASGRTMFLYKGSAATVPLLTIELDSEILALATQGTSTVVAATQLGLVALEVPH
jgi:WD40 repeat protein